MRISDWSSDVCSSDPVKATGPITRETAAMLEARTAKLAGVRPALTPAPAKVAAAPAAAPVKQAAVKSEAKKVASTHPDGEKLYKTSTEERSVGKECVSS